MRNVSGSAFRKRLAQHLDECESSCEPLRITTLKRGRGDDQYQRMIVISENQYTMMIEQIND